MSDPLDILNAMMSPVSSRELARTIEEKARRLLDEGSIDLAEYFRRRDHADSLRGRPTGRPPA